MGFSGQLLACPGYNLFRFPSHLLCGAGNVHLSSFLPVINKYKRRRFQKTKNLLTGETEADPEMIKVIGSFFFFFLFLCLFFGFILPAGGQTL